MTLTILIIYILVLFYIAYLSFGSVNNYHDFFIARQQGNYLSITGSLLATILGGSAIIGTIDAGKELGWATMWFMICASLGLFALIPLAGRVKQMGRFTLPELIETLYGREAKLISSLLIPLAWLGIVAAQVIAAARILQSFTNLSYEAGAIASGLVFIVYTIAGGQFSILKTDLFQTLLIFTGLVFVSLFAYTSRCTDEIGKSLPPITLSFPFNERFRPFDLLILIIAYSTTFTAGPDIYSRIFSAKNKQVARRALLSTAFILLPLAFLIGFLSVYGSNCIPTVHKGSVLIDISNYILPGWSIPFIVITFLSVVLSSADTTLLSGSIILTGLIQQGKYGNNSMKITRIILLVFGLGAILIALNFDSIIEILLMALTVFSSAFFLPILFGLLGYKSDRRFVSAAILSGCFMSLTGKILDFLGILTLGNILILSAFIINGLLLVLGRKKLKKNRILPV